MEISWSPEQLRRLEELGETRLRRAARLRRETGAPRATDEPFATGGRREPGVPPASAERTARFGSAAERDAAFQELESRLVKLRRAELAGLQRRPGGPALYRLERELAEVLEAEGFSRVLTPTLMSRGMLARMGIREGHPLFSKIFWLDERRCLRPMLAPHLYSLLADLLRVWEKPVRIFEAGSCFRRETQGARHAAEFTMLNLCEMGLPAERCRSRLEELAARLMQAAGIREYSLESERSIVYGETVDLVARGVELGSAALGPHVLDRPWRLTEPWVGLGLGLERLVMVREGGESLARWGRNLGYLDGLPLRL